MPFPYALLTGCEALDKPQILSRATGPSDGQRREEDRSAAFGATLSAHACAEAGFEDSTLERWFCGIKLESRSAPLVVALQDYPSARNQPDVAAVELYRLASLGEIHWRDKDCAHPDLKVRPSQLIANGEEVRVVHDWPRLMYNVNEARVKPPVKYGDMDELSQLLSSELFRALARFP